MSRSQRLCRYKFEDNNRQRPVNNAQPFEAQMEQAGLQDLRPETLIG